VHGGKKSRSGTSRILCSETGFQSGAQPGTIEVAADQHDLVVDRALLFTFVEREALGDQVKDIALVALLEPEQPLGAIDIVGQSFQETLEISLTIN
jgi:hypothetical protein